MTDYPYNRIEVKITAISNLNDNQMNYVLGGITGLGNSCMQQDPFTNVFHPMSCDCTDTMTCQTCQCGYPGNGGTTPPTLATCAGLTCNGYGC